MENWKWTDELVEQYCRENLIEYPHRTVKMCDFKRLNSNKQDWEILSFNHGFCEYRLVGSRYHRNSNGFEASLNHVPPHAEIKSVRRLSDSSVWSVGDDCLQGEIKRFQVSEWSKEMHAYFEDGETGCVMRLDDLRKPKQILFTTEDGKAVYEWDNVWIVRRNDLTQKPFCRSIDPNHVYPDNIYFSTEQLAKEYIAKHKPKPYVVFTKETYGYKTFKPYNLMDEKIDESAAVRFDTKEDAIRYCVFHATSLTIIEVHEALYAGLDVTCGSAFNKLKQLVEQKLKTEWQKH